MLERTFGVPDIVGEEIDIPGYEVVGERPAEEGVLSGIEDDVGGRERIRVNRERNALTFRRRIAGVIHDGKVFECDARSGNGECVGAESVVLQAIGMDFLSEVVVDDDGFIGVGA